jgi:hypothetical protein
MATGRALEQISTETQVGGEVVSFRARADRLTKPRQSMDDRLQRAGFAVASELFTAYEGTDITAGSQVHAPTVVAILATLAAEFAQAASAVNRRDSVAVNEAGWVLGGAADVILFAADKASGMATVWDVVEAAAISRGLNASELPDMQAVAAHADATIGDKPYPVLTVASSYRPKALLRAAAARHRHIAQAHAADEGLCSAHEQALVMGAAIGQIIRHEERPAPLALLAAEAMTGGARLAPLPFAVG